MSQGGQNLGSTKSPLDAAQKIVAELQGMTSDHQSLALKFAMETLGLQVSPTMSQVSAILSSHGTQKPAAGAVTQHSDIKTFTAAKAPKSDQQFTAVVAYYYQFEAKPEERKDVIDPATMKEAARLAGRPQVARWAMTLTNAKNAGYLNSAGHGKFRLSPVGENLVAITLPGNGAGSQGNRSAAGKKAAKKTSKTRKRG